MLKIYLLINVILESLSFPMKEVGWGFTKFSNPNVQ